MAISASLGLDALCRLAARQCDNLFPDGTAFAPGDIEGSARTALQRLEHCFAAVANRYFFDGTQARFDHLHGDQYAMWLYFLSNQMFRDGAPAPWCSKLFLLNKALHGCDIFYEVELPSVFLLVHPLATVLGRGKYQDHLLVYQRCGIGSNHDIYPSLGRHVTLRPGSAVLGDSRVGDFCSIAAESLVLDHEVPANTVYFGNPRDHWSRARNSAENIWRT
jgi:serine O-acetyltransferase